MKRATINVQMQFAGCIGVAVLLTIFALDLLSRNASLALRLEQAEDDFARKTCLPYSNPGYFQDKADRLLNEELPGADYSKGGVYFIGASAMMNATHFRLLDADQRALIHNYSIPQSNHSHKFQYIRFLVEHEGLLKAGGDKTLIVFGLNYYETEIKYNMGYFLSLWPRHGLYTIDRENGIREVEVNPLWKSIHFERVRMTGCLQALGRFVQEHTILLAGQRPENEHDMRAFEKHCHSFAAEDWKGQMSAQLQEFGAMLDYLKQRHARVAVVMLPYGSWEKGWDFAATYNADLAPICQSRSIPLYDFSRTVPDQEFGDYTHVNIFGAERLQPALLQIAVPFLASTGALSEPSLSGGVLSRGSGRSAASENLRPTGEMTGRVLPSHIGPGRN